MVRHRAEAARHPHQQRRRLRKSSPTSSGLGIKLSEKSLKFLVYLCTLLLLVILIFAHRSLPTPSYSHAHGRSSSHLRDGLRPGSSTTNQNFRSFLSTGIWRGSTRVTSPRIAIVLPFIGSGPESVPPYLGLFCSAAGGAASLVDFLIIHANVLETFSQRMGSRLCPPNVKFINVHTMDNLASNYLLRLMDQIPEDEWALGTPQLLVRVITKHLMAYPYALVEYKPTFGHVFAEFLQDYSHWGYSDLDVVFGDMGRWITPEELSEFDIVTYGYGDQNRVYLRGQFTFHRNSPKINQLWRKCEYLSRLDQRFGKILSGEQKLKFESAEGCYSAAVLDRQDIRVKYATKAFTDVQGMDPVNTHGLYIARQKYDPPRKSFLPLHPRNRGDEETKAKRVVVYKVKSPGEGMALLQASPLWFELDEVYRDTSQPLQWEVGRKELIELAGPDSKPNCMYWAQKKYQSKLCVASNVTEFDTVFWVNGLLYKQRYQNAKLNTNVATAPFFHFQEWKRYYRESQLASFRPGSEFTTFVLVKEGAIPVYPNKPIEGGGPPLWQSSSIKSPLGASILHWKAGNAELDRKLLPVRSYCLSSRPRTNPPIPPAPQCVQQVSWWDSDRVEILSMAPAWQTDLDINLDVTLLLTVQIPIYQSRDAGAMNGVLDIVIANLNRWQGQASVLIVHVALDDEGQRDDVISLMESRLRERQVSSAMFFNGAEEGEIGGEYHMKPMFGIDSCLIALIFDIFAADAKRNKNKKHAPPETYHVSRKALLNMAIDASPTRWYVSGIELERGIVLSNDAAFFAHRAALSHQVIPGNILFIPQWALDVDDDEYDVLSLSNIMEFEKKENIIKEPLDYETDLCEDDGQQGKNNPDKIFDDATAIWWKVTTTIVEDKSSYLENEDLTSQRATVQNDLQLRLCELLTPEQHFALFAMDESPILLIDNQGPHSGMLTNEMTREVEEFGGKRCYNALRMAQLAIMGYEFNVLPGAFAASTKTSRSAAYWNGTPEGSRGEVDEDMLGGSRCDGCFMFDEEHESILENIICDERKRPAKAAVLWEETDFTADVYFGGK